MMVESSGPGVLAQLSDALAAGVERAAGYTVVVNARRRIGATGVVWRSDGVIATASHVVERDERIGVVLPDGRELEAELAGRDPGSDLAVLRVDASGLDDAPAAAQARVGHFVLAVGRPEPGDPMASLGVVGTVGGPWRTFHGGAVEGYLRADATMYPGFSGGPLIDTAGAVLGITSSRLGRDAAVAIPYAAAAEVIDSLLEHGRIRRGFLGVASQPTSLPVEINGGSEVLLVITVERGSPADRAGLIIGDSIVSLGDTRIRRTEDLQALLGSETVGRETALVIVRGGERRELSVVIGEREQEQSR